MISENFIWVSLALITFATGLYVRDTLKGETQPNRVTFFLWGAVPLIIYLAQRREGGGEQILFTLVIALLQFSILAASFVNKKAYWKLGKFDIVCGAISLIALFFLVVSGKGMLALWLSIIADFFAGMPTIIKSYKYPESETASAYAIEMIASGIILLTVQSWVFVDYVFSAYLFLTSVLFTVLLVFPRPKKKVQKLKTA